MDHDVGSEFALGVQPVNTMSGCVGGPELMKMECKGMVQYLEQTYRIMKISRRSYEVIRILDDTFVGRFEVDPRLSVHPSGITREHLLQIAMTALKQAKVSWIGPIERKPLDGIVAPPARDSVDCVG